MMRWFATLPLVLAALALAGCYDDTAPRDVTPPAAPRGLNSVTGDGRVSLHWLENTEADVAGYNVYESDCSGGPGCPYRRVGTTTGTSLTVGALTNGVTQYFAVAAFDRAGNESDLSYDDIFDTPRPEGFGLVLADYHTTPATSGWDFSAFAIRPWDDARTDMYFSLGSLNEMLVPDLATGIQDLGYGASLDAVDVAPSAGWSPTGGVELIVGHNYVVRTRDNHYAKFRVTGLGSGVTFDWAYQTAVGNRELRARPAAPVAGGSATAPIASDLTPNRSR